MPPFAECDTAAQLSASRPRVYQYPFTADCTLYLANETLQRRTVTGDWYSPHQHNEVEWEANAEHALAWMVGVLHLHDPRVPARVDKYTVHRLHGFKKAPAQRRAGVSA
jgi:hypothetical protein